MSKGKELLKWIISNKGDDFVDRVLKDVFVETTEQEGIYNNGYLKVNNRFVEFNTSEVTDVSIKGITDVDAPPSNPVLQTEETMRAASEAAASAAYEEPEEPEEPEPEIRPFRI